MGIPGAFVSSIRRAAGRLLVLREAQSWSSIVTSKHLAVSMRTLADEVEQALREDARDEAMQKLMAELVVVAMALSAQFSGDLVAAVEEEIGRREDFAFVGEEAEIAGPTIAVHRLRGISSRETLESGRSRVA